MQNGTPTPPPSPAPESYVLDESSAAPVESTDGQTADDITDTLTAATLDLLTNVLALL
jgi:hypothetical protein